MRRYLLLIVSCCLGSISTLSAQADNLKEGFSQPPGSARPWVYWFWNNGNVTKEGITADLEAMQRVGVGGVLLMDIAAGAPAGPVDFNSSQWQDLFAHACREARRLGLQINMNNAAGYSSSGGPWVTPELAMQQVVWTETAVEGPQRAALKLPGGRGAAFRDIAVLAFPTPANPLRIEHIDRKAWFIQDEGFLNWHTIPPGAEWPAAPADAVVPRDRIVDLTAKMDKDGKLVWDVPAGKWTILRMGHSCIGTQVEPASASGIGLECDKLSKEAVEAHFNGFLGKLLAGNRAFISSKTLVSTHIDSWEVGSQNWTPRMREEFRRLRGYDPLLLLPVITGRVVDSQEVSERFLFDLRQTISDLFAANYAGEMRELANRQGIRLSIEGYYSEPCDDLTYGGQADEPMGEFWSMAGSRFSASEAASEAHVYGKPIAGAESFTACGDKGRNYPGSIAIKTLGDWAFSQGINRFVIHRYAMQPWPAGARAPGFGFGDAGFRFDRGQTYWEQSKPWVEYLTRCQYLLQQGLFVADICFLAPEGVQLFMPPLEHTGDHVASRSNSKYSFDACPPDGLLTRMSVKDGRLVLPDGMSYRILVLPSTETMTPKLLRAIKKLVDAGATVIGPRPKKSPSLSGYPACDTEVQKLTAELWDTGKVTANTTPEAALQKLGVRPDFESDRPLLYCHRRLGDADVYFVSNSVGTYFDQPHSLNSGLADSYGPSNPAVRACDATCTFRVTGAQPELWNPETGRIMPLPAYEEVDGCTRVPLHLNAAESAFIVFRGGRVNPATRVVSVTHNGQELLYPAAPPAFDSAPIIDLVRQEIWQPGSYTIKTADGRQRELSVTALPQPLEITGPWEVSFPPHWGAPDRVTLDKLISLSEQADPGVRYFSGVATYRTKFPLSQAMLSHRLYLDLGGVAVMAEASLNGKKLGVLWKAPYRVEISDAARTGENVLEVKVVNLWLNRLIGDEQLPEDSDRTPDGFLKSWPQWLTEGKPSPTGRYTFSTEKFWKKDDALAPSGLLGPVTVLSAEGIRVER
jgi:hypothetical protein